ncbi:response regulator transcription factor [Colwellia sp. Arc7-635]|jgi:DNA-binding NarL/FixJ family response regulator|uniref:response regulator transcription factor n=1 Tax=Colwellia sp. Arc7-635 TaxID=2497879 RepID=UPI000F8537DB|nr:response regulator transcription factor [Colwellia sp. Arc7-635]AZQ85133.1 response regulator transcription factor [Colwellia sp. Arc7-635]
MTLNTKIIIADDHPLFRQALALMLKSSFVCSSLLEAQTIPELEEQLIETSDIDLILLDLDIPGGQGFNTLSNIRHLYPEIAVVIISGFEEPDTIRKAMSLGAAGFIPKSTPVPEMIKAVNKVIQGELWTPEGDYNPDEQTIEQEDKLASLTAQQRKILLMFAEGLLNKQIAYELGLSESTIKSHASTIFLKLGVKSRTQAVILLNERQQSYASFT